MYIVEREEGYHLVPDVAAELQGLVLAGAEGGGEYCTPAHLVETRQTGIVGHSAQEVAGHVYLGHGFHTALAGVGHNLADVVLGVVTAVHGVGAVHPQVLGGQQTHGAVLGHGQTHAHGVLVVVVAPGAFLRQQRVFLYFYAPALVVGQMPVETVQLVHGHQVDDLFHFGLGEEMAGAVEVETAPAEPRTVGNPYVLQLGLGGHLTQRGDAVHHTGIVAAVYLYAAAVDGEPVAARGSLIAQREAYVAALALLGGGLLALQPGQTAAQVLGGLFQVGFRIADARGG